MRLGTPFVASLAVATILSFAPVVRAAEPPLVGPYAITDLGTLGGAVGHAYGIADTGAVCGAAQNTAGVYHGFLYINGAISDLGSLSGASYGYAVNSIGEVAGFTNYAGTSHKHAILDQNGAITDIGTLGGTDSIARSINNSGEIVGQANVADNSGHAFLYCDQGLVDLGTLGGLTSLALGINNTGKVVGQADTDATHFHAFLYNGTTLTDIAPASTLGATYVNANSVAYAINDLDQIVGSYTTTAGITHGFTEDFSGRFTDIGPLAKGSSCILYAINNHGVAVGDSDVSGSPHAVIEVNGQLIDVNSLLEPGSGWTISHASGINDLRQIVGVAVNASGAKDAVILTPPGSAAYTVSNIGDLGGSSTPYGLNIYGEAVGTSFLPSGDYEAFADVNGLPTPLGFLPGGSNSTAAAIGDDGTIIGGADTPQGDQHAYFYNSTGFTDIGAVPASPTTAGNTNALGGNDSTAYGISGQDDIVGIAQTSDGSTQAFADHALGAAPAMTSMDTADAGSGAYGVNSLNYAVGFVQTADGDFSAARFYTYSSDFITPFSNLPGITDPDLLPYLESAAYGVNNANDAVGYCTTFMGDPHATMWINGAPARDLGTLGGTESYAYSINSAQEAVGYSSTNTGLIHGFLYAHDAMIDLNTLLPVGSTLTILYAYAINEQGQIACVAEDVNGNYSSILLSPPTPTLQYSCITIGDLGGGETQVNAINDVGQATGSSLTPVTTHGFLYTPKTATSSSTLVNLGDLGDGTYYSEGFSINDYGHVSGIADTAPYGTAEPFFYGTSMTSINPAETQSDVFYLDSSINSSDEIVGTMADSTQQAFLWNGTLSFLTSSSIDARAIAINNSGHIGGDYNDEFPFLDDGFNFEYSNIAPTYVTDSNTVDLYALNSFDHALLFEGSTSFIYDGGWHQLSNGNSFALAASLNDSDQIVGYGSNFGGIWHGDILYNLNNLVPPTSGLTIQEAVGINNYGWIAANGTLGGKPVAVILVPPAITTTATINGPLGFNGWYTGPVQVSLNSVMAGDSVYATIYALDSGPSDLYTSPLAINADGTHTLTDYGVDKLGNNEPVETTSVLIDSVAPVATEADSIVSTGTQIAITATDKGSGVSATYYILDGGTTTTYSKAFVVTNGGTHHLEYWSVDKAGNVETPHLTHDFQATSHLVGIALTPTTVVGGNSVSVLVSLSGTTATGATVSLASNTASVTLPATVTIPVGQSSATVIATTQPVTTSTSAVISGSLAQTSNTDTASATLVVSPATLSSLSVLPSIVASSTGATGTISLTGVTAQTVSVTISSSNTAVAILPSSAIAVALGQSSIQFPISIGSVSSVTTVTITAKLGSVTKTATVTVTPTASAVSTVTVVSSSIAGGTTTTGTVTLAAAAPTGGEDVQLTSSNTNVATVPATVLVATGATTASFTVSGLPTTVSGTTTITASGGGGSSSVAVTVVPPALSAITISPTSVISGITSTANVTLTGTVAAGSTIIVTLSSSSTVVSVPATLTFVPGSSSASATITTYGVTSTQTLTITAKYGSVTKTATITVAPLPSAVKGVTIAPTSVSGDVGAVGTVTLVGAAPTGGQSVILSSNQASAVVSGSVVVPAGSTTVNFAVTTQPVASTVTATVTASAGGTSKTATLAVTPPGLSTLSLSPTQVAGGETSTGTVTLTGVVAAGSSALVTLSSTLPSATVPATVTVLSGQSSATFTIATGAVTANTSSTIGAVYGATTLSQALTITQGALVSSVTLAPTSLVGGDTARATVTLASAAPTTGQTVTITTSDATDTTLVSSVIVPAGATTTTFSVQTSPVTATKTATITVAAAGSTSNASLTILPGSKVTAVSLSPTSVTGGVSSTGTVTLAAKAPTGGEIVTLTTSDTTVATVPTTVTVAAGSATATFPVATLPAATTGTASITGLAGGGNAHAALTVLAPALASIALSPTSAAAGGVSVATVTLTGPTTQAVQVLLTSSVPTSATVPVSVTIPANASSATLSVQVANSPAATSAVITASYNGVSKTATLGITAGSPVSDVTLSPASLIGGFGSTGKVTLTAAAPAGGEVVALSSSDTTVSLPASISIAAGATSVNFAITTSVVAAPLAVTISATGGGVTATAALAVNPGSPVATVSLNPAAVVGGASSVGTVTLSAAAPTGGQVVSLNSDNTNATVPPSVTVASGQTTATFGVATNVVTSSGIANISATAGGATASAPLTVSPGVAIQSVTLAASTLTGGSSTTATVTLGAAAPGTGELVELSTSDASISGIPANVMVAAGATKATFTVTTLAVTAVSSVNISASSGGAPISTPLTIYPSLISSFTITPTSVSGGTSVAGKITLASGVPAGQTAVVTITSSNTAIATAPLTVVIPAGHVTGPFTINTSVVPSDSSVVFTASCQGVTYFATLNVLTAVSVSVAPTSVVSGTSSTCTVTLATAAGTGGQVVTVQSSSPSVASVPASVTVAAGATTATFPITTIASATSASITITAKVGSASGKASLTVSKASLLSLKFTPDPEAVGSAAQGTITLAGPAPTGGAVVTVTNAGTTVATVTIAAGATSGNFSITETSAGTYNLTATYNATSVSTSLTFVPPGQLVQFFFQPSTTSSSSPAICYVYLNGPAPTGGAAVGIFLNNNFYTTLIIPAGRQSVQGSIAPLGAGTYTFTAQYLAMSYSAAVQFTP